LAIERFAAFDGAGIERADCVRDGLITEDNAYRPGAIGAAMSHVSLWRRCAAESEPFHIAEDDATLRSDFEAAGSAALGGLGDWDIVLWTHNFDWPVMIEPAPGVGPVVLQFDPAVAPHRLEAFQAATTKPLVTPLISAAGLSCYSVSPQGAARLLAGCLPIGNRSASYAARSGLGWDNTGIDVELSRHYAGWRAFIAVPPLAVACNDQSGSTIRGHLAAMHDPAIANKATG
jgi:hypothetical protein